MLSVLTDVVLNVLGFQLLLLAAVLLTRRAAVPLQRGLLVAFLLSKAFLVLRWFFYHYGILEYGRHWQIYFPTAAGFFLLAPLLYLYGQSLCARGFALRRRHLLHLAPFVVVLAVACASVRLWMVADETHPPRLATALLEHFWDGFWALNFIQILVYVLGMVRTIGAYRAGLGESYSSIEQLDLGWLRGLMTVAILYWIFIVSRGTLAILDVTTPTLLATLDLFSITIFLVFTTVLVVKGMGQLKVIPGLNGRPRQGAARMSPGDLKAFAERLDRLMAAEKPYLEPALTIDELALQLELPAHLLSQVINSVFKQNFFHYINHHRVEAAKAQLRDPGNNRKTMLQILHEVGFNSKTTFNEAFKRHTRMTPSAFRKQAQGAAAS